MKKVKLGFIGCGYMGQLAHIANYATMQDVELTALADMREKTAAEVAKRYGIHSVYRDHRELLDKADVDAVVAIMGYDQHHNVVPDILNAGKNCLTEKPICIKVSTAQKLQQLAEKKGIVYHIGYMKRCDLASKLMKEKIAEWKKSNECGALKYLRVSMPPGDWTHQIENAINLGDKPAGTIPAGESLPDKMSKEEQQRYNGFINYYIHQVNLIRYLLGEDYTVEFVDAREVLMVCKSKSGITIALEMNAYEVRDEWHEYYKACFDKGFISMSLPAPMARQRSGDLIIYRNTKSGGAYEHPVLPPVWCMREQAHIFIEEVQGKISCISPAADAVKDLEIAEAFIAKSKK